MYGWSAPKESIGEEIKKIPEISCKNGYFFLNGRESIVSLRTENGKIAKRLWKTVSRYGWLFHVCPFVRMAAVCNSLTVGNVKETSDIDLFIVAEDKKLATARFFAKILTQLFGKRVHHDKIAGRFCLSFFVTTKTMNLEPITHEFDPHLAYLVAAAVPIYGKKVYLEFLEQNIWIKPYFKRDTEPRLGRVKKNAFLDIIKYIIEILLRICGAPLENFLYKIQLKRDNERKKALVSADGVIISKTVFKFHEHDTRREIASRFQSRLERI